MATIIQTQPNQPGLLYENRDVDFNEHVLSVFLNPVWRPPPTLFKPVVHPRHDQVASEVDEYFLRHWNFSSDKARKTFLATRFSWLTCLFFPTSKNDRINFACRLITFMCLIDDFLESMSLEEGEAYNARLIQLARGDISPNRDVPAEYILYDLWQGMRACDLVLANEVMEALFVVWRAQTDRTRLSINGLEHYFKYRESDAGQGLVSALASFTMSIHLEPEELDAVKQLEQNCSKHISVVNDIYSWDKELKASKTAHDEGAVLCSVVKVLADEAGLDISASKRVLWYMAREYELVHQELVAAQLAKGVRRELEEYMKGLEYQMSGNEEWSTTTARYHQ